MQSTSQITGNGQLLTNLLTNAKSSILKSAVAGEQTTGFMQLLQLLTGNLSAAQAPVGNCLNITDSQWQDNLNSLLNDNSLTAENLTGDCQQLSNKRTAASDIAPEIMQQLLLALNNPVHANLFDFGNMAGNIQDSLGQLSSSSGSKPLPMLENAPMRPTNAALPVAESNMNQPAAMLQDSMVEGQLAVGKGGIAFPEAPPVMTEAASLCNIAEGQLQVAKSAVVLPFRANNLAALNQTGQNDFTGSQPGASPAPAAEPQPGQAPEQQPAVTAASPGPQIPVAPKTSPAPAAEPQPGQAPEQRPAVTAASPGPQIPVAPKTPPAPAAEPQPGQAPEQQPAVKIGRAHV